MSKHRSKSSFVIPDSVANVIRLGSLVAIAVGLFVIVIGAGAVYLNLTAQLELERAERVASQQADRIADELAEIQTALRDASVVDAARSGVSDDTLRGALRERGVVNILDVRVLPDEIDAIAVGDNGLGFATTELAIEAVRGERAEIRVLQAGTPDESLAFAQRLPGEAGVVLLRTTVSVVGSLLEDREQLDFLALAQRDGDNPILLGSRGRASAGSLRESPIAGSRLTLQWRKATSTVPLGNQAAVILGCSGLIGMMIGLLLRRRTRLARYLGGEAPDSGHRVAASRQSIGPEAKAPAGSGGSIQQTMVLDGDDDQEDEPETVVADAPELPEWLREENDEPQSGRG